MKKNKKEKRKNRADAGSSFKEKKAKKAKRVKTEPVSDEAAALIFRALGDDSRLRILRLLEQGELCGADLLKDLEIVQSTLSHHMKILCDAGLVTCRREGRWSMYSIDRKTMDRASAYLKQYRGKRKPAGKQNPEGTQEPDAQQNPAGKQDPAAEQNSDAQQNPAGETDTRRTAHERGEKKDGIE